MPNSIRSSAIARKMPTPKATERIRIILGTDGTCCARTCRSGSEMVMIKPNKKDRAITADSFLVRVMQLPTRSPIGVMDISAPNVKNIIPVIRRTAPSKKHSRILGEMGAMLKDSSSTIPMIGPTAIRASLNFSLSFRV